MGKKKQIGITIGNVKGDVVYSQGQKGGLTGHTINSEPKKKFNIWKWLGSISAFIVSLTIIFTYFGIGPFKKNPLENNAIEPKTQSVISQPNTTIKKPVKVTNKKMLDKQEDKSVKIDNVKGDAVVSVGQTGGITAHTIEAPKYDLKGATLLNTAVGDGAKVYNFKATPRHDTESIIAEVKNRVVDKKTSIEIDYRIGDPETFQFISEIIKDLKNVGYLDVNVGSHVVDGYLKGGNAESNLKHQVSVGYQWYDPEHTEFNITIPGNTQ